MYRVNLVAVRSFAPPGLASTEKQATSPRTRCSSSAACEPAPSQARGEAPPAAPQSCSTCSYRRELEELRAAIGIVDDARLVSVLRTLWGLQPVRVRMLLRLAAAKGMVVSSEALADDTSSGDPDPGLIRQHIFHIRERFGQDMIVTHWQRGYSATPALLARIEADVGRARELVYS
jgi:hypothetical protein